MSFSEKHLISGFKIQYFIVISFIILYAAYLDLLPKGMIGALSFMLVLGFLFEFIGDRTPILKDYLGGGATFTIFASATLVYYNCFPKNVFINLTTFMKSGGFLDFYIAALIVGSILGMSRKLLIQSALKYLPVIIGGVIGAMLLTGTVGFLLGYGFKQAILFIAIPIMGGGMGAGAVPLAQIFSKSLGGDPAKILSVMVPAVALGNATAIVSAALLNKLGKKYPNLSGNGKLLKNFEAEETKKSEENGNFDMKVLGYGLLISLTFFVLGKLLSTVISMHAYALMILSVALVKALNCIDRKYEEYAAMWFQFVAKTFTSALLVGIGVAYTDLSQVISAFNFTYFALVVTTVLGAIIGTALISRLVGFYAIEASITAGLCMANMGGTGDVAVLSSAERMELMPFAQISSRIGGAFMLILTSFIIQLL